MPQSGFTPVQTYSSSTPGNVPLAANLINSTQGAEMAINIADGKLFYKNSSGVVTIIATNGTAVIGGSTTQVQYNNGGVLAGSANLTFNGTTLTANTLNLTNALGVAYGGTGQTTFTAGQVLYGNGTSGLSTSANMTFDGSTLTTLNSAYTGTLTGGTGIVNLGSGQFYKDASGNVGIGLTPNTWTGALKALQIGSTASLAGGSGEADLYCNAYNNGTNIIYQTSSYASQFQMNNLGQFRWYTAPSGTAGNAVSFTQAMTLDNSGRVLIGLTSDPAGFGGRLSISGSGHIGYIETTASSGYACLTLKRAGATSGDQMYFYTTTGLAGIISSSGTSTSYGTSSDYRLKEDVQPMSGALAKIAQLKPVTYKWKADGSDSEGFIAHELQEIFPGAVIGEKDAIDEKGNIKPQNIDTSFLVATLTAAIQEQQALIENLTTRLTALEGK